MSHRVYLSGSELFTLMRGELVRVNGMIVGGSGVDISLQNAGFPLLFAGVVEYLSTPECAAFSVRGEVEEVRRWVVGVNQRVPSSPPPFLAAFITALYSAGPDVYYLLRPTLFALKEKFPQYKFEGAL